MFVDGSFADTYPVADGFDAGPAIAFAPSKADQVRIDRKLNGCHGNIENLVWQTEEFFAWRTILFQPLISVRSLIHSRNASFGMRIRLPTFMRGNPLERTNS